MEKFSKHIKPQWRTQLLQTFSYTLHMVGLSNVDNNVFQYFLRDYPVICSIPLLSLVRNCSVTGICRRPVRIVSIRFVKLILVSNLIFKTYLQKIWRHMNRSQQSIVSALTNCLTCSACAFLTHSCFETCLKFSFNDNCSDLCHAKTLFSTVPLIEIN